MAGKKDKEGVPVIVRHETTRVTMQKFEFTLGASPFLLGNV